MGLSARLYLFEQDGTVRRIPRRVAEGCYAGKDAIPAYAGTRQRVLEVLVLNENGKPKAIQSAMGHYLVFDETGSIHESAMEEMREIMDFAFPDLEERDSKVVSLSPRRKEQIWQERSRWKPTSEELDQIVADLTRKPGTKGFADVVGVAMKRHTLTYEARTEIAEISSKFTTLGWGISQLSEKALPGFIAEARKRAKDDRESEFYWEATALDAERQLELKRLRRSGRGEWVAVVQLFRHTGPSSMEVAFEVHRTCDGEAAAIEAMKQLIQEHCGKAAPTISIEAKTMPVLEWQLLDGRPM